MGKIFLGSLGGEANSAINTVYLITRKVLYLKWIVRPFMKLFLFLF